MSVLVFVAAILMVQSDQSNNFNSVWNETEKAIRNRYYAASSRSEEMNRLLEKYRTIAQSAHDRAEFAKYIQDMIREFRDSHFGFFPVGDPNYGVMDALANPTRASKFGNIGAFVIRTPDGYKVSMVLDGSEAARVGIRKGDSLVTVDGKPFEPLTSFETPWSVKLTVSHQGNKAEFEVRPTKETSLEMFLDATKESSRIITINGRKIGYFHLWTQANDNFRKALSAAVYGKLVDTDAFILDLRDGYGGRPEGFADPFFRPEMKIDWISTEGTVHSQFGYQRPLVVLINGGSRSAKEVLSQILQKSHRATLIGSRTAGNVLGTWPVKISDWAYLEIPTTDVVSDGIRLEGKGVIPDIPVAREYDEQGNDLYIARALDFLKNAKPN